MNKYKALIKQEVKSVRWMFIYFCLILGSLPVFLMVNFKERYITLMERGINGTNHFPYSFLSSMNLFYPSLIIAAVIGIILLVNVQFKDYKSGEVGRFLKCLPVRSEKHFIIKVFCGMLSYTIPFLLVVGPIYWIKANNTEWMRGLYTVISLDKLWDTVNSNGYIGQVLVIYYLSITAGYLFLVLMQYLVVWPKASLVIGGIITVVPYYLALIVKDSIYNRFFYTEVVDRRFDATLFLPWVYGHADSGYGWSYFSDFELRVDWIEYIGSKTVILLIVCMSFLVIAYKMSGTFKIEELDILMPHKSVRIIFCIGVAVCSGLIPVFLKGSLGMLYNASNIQVFIGSIVCMVIGYVIGHKVASLGTKKRRCVGYEEV